MEGSCQSRSRRSENPHEDTRVAQNYVVFLGGPPPKDSTHFGATRVQADRRTAE